MSSARTLGVTLVDEPHDTLRPCLRRHRNSRRPFRAPPTRRQRPQGLGRLASLRGLEGSRRHRQPRLRCAEEARFGDLCDGRGRSARDHAGRVARGARPRRRGDRRALLRRRSRAGAACRRKSATGWRRPRSSSAPDHVRGDYPEWLAEHFEAAFGGTRRRKKARRSRRGRLWICASIF